MGGIVSRTYIQSDEYKAENDVRKFAMVGTPNQGSLFAYYAWDGADPMRADRNAFALNPSFIPKPNIFFYTNAIHNFAITKTGSGVCVFANPKRRNLFVSADGNAGYGFPLFCNRKKIKSVIEKYARGVQELTPTYNTALMSDETDEYINYSQNTHLIDLNDDADLWKNVNAKIFTGDDENTLETIVVGEPGNTFYPYGKPLYYEQVTGNGDGTVPSISAQLPGLEVSSGEGSHGGLPGRRVADILEFIK